MKFRKPITRTVDLDEDINNSETILDSTINSTNLDAYWAKNLKITEPKTNNLDSNTLNTNLLDNSEVFELTSKNEIKSEIRNENSVFEVHTKDYFSFDTESDSDINTDINVNINNTDINVNNINNNTDINVNINNINNNDSEKIFGEFEFNEEVETEKEKSFIFEKVEKLNNLSISTENININNNTVNTHTVNKKNIVNNKKRVVNSNTNNKTNNNTNKNKKKYKETISEIIPISIGETLESLIINLEKDAALTDEKVSNEYSIFIIQGSLNVINLKKKKNKIRKRGSNILIKIGQSFRFEALSRAKLFVVYNNINL